MLERWLLTEGLFCTQGAFSSWRLFKVFIYLFIWLRGVLVAAGGVFITSLAVFACGAGVLSTWHTGSGVATRSFNSPAACGILPPRPGIELVSPAPQGRLSATGTLGKSRGDLFGGPD